MKNLRIGSVPYLNSKPFLSGFDTEEITFLPPSKLAPELRAGELDLAIVPVFECLAWPHYKIIEGLSISSHGAVKSVILLHRKPLHEIKSIAADSDSLTSIHLLKVLLHSHWEISPQIVPEGTEADGMLWIGDRALRYRQELKDHTCTDLGQAWLEFTGLPFVFAVWALSPLSKATKDELKEFRDICLSSVEQRHRIATTSDELEYFTRYIQYGLGGKEKEAIARFRDECAKLGFIPTSPEPIQYLSP